MAVNLIRYFLRMVVHVVWLNGHKLVFDSDYAFLIGVSLNNINISDTESSGVVLYLPCVRRNEPETQIGKYLLLKPARRSQRVIQTLCCI